MGNCHERSPWQRKPEPNKGGALVPVPTHSSSYLVSSDCMMFWAPFPAFRLSETVPENQDFCFFRTLNLEITQHRGSLIVRVHARPNDK
jgi:hypothetical protein